MDLYINVFVICFIFFLCFQLFASLYDHLVPIPTPYMLTGLPVSVLLQNYTISTQV